MYYINKISSYSSYINPINLIKAINAQAKKVESFVLENWRVILIPTAAAMSVYSAKEFKKSKVFEFIKREPRNSSVIFANIATPIATLSLPALALFLYYRMSRRSSPPSNSLPDLVAQAKDAKSASTTLERKKELNDLITVLGMKDKGNPILVGPAGCGKTTLVKDFAAKIAKGNVPDVLKDAAIFSLNIDALFAGAKYVGESEARFISFMDEVISHPNAIVFIDEVHRIMQGSQSTQQATNLSEKLKPYMTLGVHFIGATTPEEYEILKADKAMERRFIKVELESPSAREITKILKAVKKRRFEDQYKVAIPDELLNHCQKKIGTTSFNSLDRVMDLIGLACSHAYNLKEKCLTAEIIDQVYENFYKDSSSAMNHDFSGIYT
ncbi:MAG: hypothetical protein ChlgKO_07930 [Chlamydiales bacterium]